MLQFLIILALSIALIAVLAAWRRDRRLLFGLRKGCQVGNAERTSAVEKASEDLKVSQADLQRRWQYLAEAQRLSHSGTFAWKVHSGELVWSPMSRWSSINGDEGIIRSEIRTSSGSKLVIRVNLAVSQSCQPRVHEGFDKGF
jgi:hypothetical protein